MLTIYAKQGHPLHLGQRGENLARRVVFDLSQWKELYGDGTVQLIVQRPGENTPYPAVVTVDGGSAVWELTDADTAIVGITGKAELQYYVGETLAKSSVWETRVSAALGDPSEAPPEPQKAWVDQVLAAGASAENAAQRAEEAAKRAEDAAGSTGGGGGTGNVSSTSIDTITVLDQNEFNALPERSGTTLYAIRG